MLQDSILEVNADQAAAREHVELLTGSADTPVWFRAIVDTGGEATKLYGPVDDRWSDLMAHQAAGCGIFLVVNEGGNSAPEITRLRALFVDGDNIPLPASWHVEPDWIVYTRDETHWHAYWRVDDLAVGAFNEAQRRLIAHYGTDEKVHDLPRVMRLAGTLHLKDPTHPRLVTIEPSFMAPGMRRSAEILAGLPPVPAKTAYEPQRASPDVDLETPCRTALVQMIARLAEPATNLGPRGGGGSDVATRDLANTLLDISSPETVIDAMVNEWMPNCTGEWSVEFIAEKVNRLAREAGRGASRKSDVGCMGEGEVNDLILMLLPDDRGMTPEEWAAFTSAIQLPDPRTPEEKAEAAKRHSQLLSKLSLSGWLTRDIKPQDFLIGEVMSTTSRMMLYAPTGLGKTNFAMAIAVHLAAGKDFLRWRIPAARRVLYIDATQTTIGR